MVGAVHNVLETNMHPGGGTGRRKGLKIPSRKACGFESRPGYYFCFAGCVALPSYHPSAVGSLTRETHRIPHHDRSRAHLFRD